MRDEAEGGRSLRNPVLTGSSYEASGLENNEVHSIGGRPLRRWSKVLEEPIVPDNR